MIGRAISIRTPAASVLLLACICLSTATPCAAQTATIYYGNGAQFASEALNAGSLQGFTQLRDRWTTNGVPTTITDVFSVPDECCLFLATAPTEVFTVAQVATLQTFLNSGGTFIVSHDGGATPAMNQVLSDLGTSLQFGAIQGSGTQLATVVHGSHPFVAGLSVGDNMYTYSPGQVTGGTALMDSPLGTHIVSVESVGLGTVMAVADFDMLNNVVGSFFPTDATQANNLVFWDNISEAACEIPEPSAILVACLGLAGMFVRRTPRRRG